MRDALSLTDQAIAYGSGRLEEAGVRAMLGAVEQGHAAALVEALAQRDGPALLARLDTLRSLGLSADGTLESMAVLLQHMAVEQAVPGALDAADPDLGDAARLAKVLPVDETQLLYSIVLQGRGELSLMADEYGALTMVLLRMLAFAPARADLPLSQPVPNASAVLSPPKPAAREVPARAAAAPPAARGADASALEPPPWLDAPPPEDEAPAAGASAALRAPAPPALAVPAEPPQPVAELVASPLGERWAELVGRLVQSGSVAALVRELAQQAGLARIDDSTQPATWHLLVERDSLRTEALRDKLGAALVAEMGEPVRLVLQAGVPQDSPSRRDAAERERRQRLAEAAIRNDPLVVELMSQFKSARIVPGSIKPI
jgi:DNA polymerase-3 subunit gamma/tau